jgi:hypothetical protein
VPEQFVEGDDVPPPECLDARLPCGCVNHEVVRLQPARQREPWLDDPCLRKVVDADLAGEEPEFPLCRDPACSHHRATSADGFRVGWAWQSDYQLLTLRRRKEARRLLRADDAPAVAKVRSGRSKRAAPGGETVSGIRDMLLVLRDARLEVATAELNAALHGGEVRGARRDTGKTGAPWVVKRAALLAWGRERRENRS